jgi:hypothetical protein
LIADPENNPKETLLCIRMTYAFDFMVSNRIFMTISNDDKRLMMALRMLHLLKVSCSFCVYKNTIVSISTSVRF